MADLHSENSNGGTRKMKQGFSLEKLIGKLKTTSPPSCTTGGSGEPSTEVTANGATQPLVEKKSRRKGHPVNYVAAAAQYEDNLDSLTAIDADLAPGELGDGQLSNSTLKVAPLVGGKPTAPSTSTPQALPPTSTSQNKPQQNKQDEIPEGTVVVNPEAPSVEEESNAPELNPEMAGSELALRTTTSSGVDQSGTYQCTICREPLYLKEPQNIRQHPVLKVVICRNCHSFYSSGEFTRDEDGYDNQCTWCGEGGNLLICDFCPKAFCKKCIRNNFKRDMLKHIENCRKWKCLVCDPKPLASHVIKSVQLQEKASVLKKMAKEQHKSHRPTSKPSVADITRDSGRDSGRDVRMSHGKIVQQSRRPNAVSSSSAAASSNYRTIVSRTTGTPNATAAPTAPSAARSSSATGADCESRVYINVPSHANIRGGEKAILSVNLSTVAAQYVNAQKIRCDNSFLESLVQEHNRFSTALADAKQVLTTAHVRYENLLNSSADPQHQAKAKLLYRETCDKLGLALRSKIVHNLTGIIKLISPSSTGKSSAAAKTAATPAPAAPPVPAAPAPPALSSIRSTLNQTAVASPRVVTPAAAAIARAPAAPVAAPSVAPAVTIKPTTVPVQTTTVPVQRSSTVITRSKQSSSVLPSAVVSSKNKEFIDIDELKKSTEKPKEVILLSSDDEEADTPTPPINPSSIKKQPVVVVHKASAANNLKAAIQSASSRSLVAASQTEEFDVGRHDPFSPTTADPADTVFKNNQTKVGDTARVSELLDFSADSDNMDADNQPSTNGIDDNLEKSVSVDNSPLIQTAYADLQFSSEDDDLVGVTPRRSTRSKSSNAVEKDTDDSLGSKGRKKSSETKESKTAEDAASPLDEARVEQPDETGSDSDVSGTDKTDKSVAAESAVQSESAKGKTIIESEPKAGPSGLSRRALKRLLKQQEQEKSAQRQTQKTDTDSPKKSANKSPEKLKVLSKELISSSSDDDDDDTPSTTTTTHSLPSATAVVEPEPASTDTPAEAPEPSSSEAPEPSSSEAPEPSSSQAPEPSSSQAPEPSSSDGKDNDVTATKPDSSTSAKPESSSSESSDESDDDLESSKPKKLSKESQKSLKQNETEDGDMEATAAVESRKRKRNRRSDSDSDHKNTGRTSKRVTQPATVDTSSSGRTTRSRKAAKQSNDDSVKGKKNLDRSEKALDSVVKETSDSSEADEVENVAAKARKSNKKSDSSENESPAEEVSKPSRRRTKKVVSTSPRHRLSPRRRANKVEDDGKASDSDEKEMISSTTPTSEVSSSIKEDDSVKALKDDKTDAKVDSSISDGSDPTVENHVSPLLDTKLLSSDEEGGTTTKTRSSRREKTSTSPMKRRPTTVDDEDELLGNASATEEPMDDVDDLLKDSDAENQPESITITGSIPMEKQPESEDSDATLTDTVKNTTALNELDALLSSSSLDSDPQPRLLLRRRAKETHKRKKEPKTKPKPLTAAERQERNIMKLKPEQRRYMRQRASGLRVSLIEKKQTQLQALLKEIDRKSVEEMDTDSKLTMRLEVGVDKLDLTDDKVVQKLLTDYKSTKKSRDRKIALEPDSGADSDLEKEIERLAKFTVLLKKAGVKSDRKPDRDRKKEKIVKKEKWTRHTALSDSDSLSDISAAKSGEESDAGSSGSNSDTNKSDIIVIPNKDQMDNEEAMKALLQQMADSDSDDESLSSVNSANPDDSDKEVKKKDTNRKTRQKSRKVHPLEQKGIGEKKGGRKKRTSSDSSSSGSSSSESDDGEDMDSSGSEVIRRRRKRKFHCSGSDGSSNSDVSIDKKLSTRESRRTKKGKKRRVIKYSSDSSSGSGSNSDSDSSSSGDSDVKVLTPSKGRHKIRKLLDDNKLKATTKSAHKVEMERRKRIEEKQKKYNEELLASESPKKLKTLKELILEKNSKGKVVVEVDPALVKKLKPHQVDAVRFLWDCVCETVERSNKGSGGGCILAHCMGLGKTLSLITFLHTLLSHEDKLGLRRMLVIAPLNTVLNWKDEVEKWTSNLEIDIDVDELQSSKKNIDRMYRLKRWHSTGGIMIMGYDLFRNLTSGASIKKKELKDRFQQYLIKPGADVIVCDEGHLLKNAKSGMRKSVMATHSRRRIVLTGTPLQNNLKEYHCMVDFVKPSLLGTAAEFHNRFVAPITNGQYEDSTPFDVKLMKKRAHVLHEMLAGCVQRRDYSELTKFLPPKHEYILSVKLSELQIKLYQFYLDKVKADGKLGIKGKLFSDFQNLSRVWSHPMALELHKQRREEEKDFIDDSTTSEETPSSEDDGSDILVNDGDDCWKPSKAKDKKKSAVEGLKEENDSSRVNSGTSTPVDDSLWWLDEVKDIKMNDVSLGYKFVLLLEILKKCEEIGDKLLLFSQGILTLDLIEDFLEMIHNSEDEITETLYGRGQWKKGVNYFRIDGTVDAAQRRRACTLFNKPNNHNARLFLISTRAGGMGINLVGANRVIIFDASWNPSYDVQAIFRAFRFGQTKPVYVYRFLAQATMEERIYERQVAKLSLSERVVDEKQIHRHFTANDLNELYNFKPAGEEDMEVPVLPKDLLLADMLESHGHLIVKVREHDSLLENREEEQLSEEERKAAWQEYQQEKERVVLPPPAPSVQPSVGYTANNAAKSSSGAMLSSLLLTDLEKYKLRDNLSRRFPSSSPEHLQKLFEAQCYEINSSRLKHHQTAMGSPQLTPNQVLMLQSQLEQQRKRDRGLFLQQQQMIAQQQQQRQLQAQMQAQAHQRIQQQQQQQQRAQQYAFPARK